MVDLNGQVTENLSVFRQIEILQAVLFLSRSILLQELLFVTKRQENVKMGLLWECDFFE